MADTIFRTLQESSSTTPVPKDTPAKDQISIPQESPVEVPYLDYAREHSKPYTAEYYKLGDTWEDPEGGFGKEVRLIEQYVAQKINSGEIANSVSAVKELLKGMEKFNNLTHEERSLVKVETLAAYVEFLMKTDKLKSNLRRYSGNG